MNAHITSVGFAAFLPGWAMYKCSDIKGNQAMFTVEPRVSFGSLEGAMTKPALPAYSLVTTALHHLYPAAVKGLVAIDRLAPAPVVSGHV